MNNFLIIDSRIDKIDEIIESILPNVKYIILDYYNDTFITLNQKISSLNLIEINNLGLLRHGYYFPSYLFLAKQQIPSTVFNVQELDSSLNTWIEIKNFLANLINIYKIKSFDFLSCRLDLYSDYQYIFSTLERQLRINIGGTKDELGSIKYGGSTILSSDNLNIINTYFNDNILNYPFLFFMQVLNIQANNFTKNYDNVLFTNTSVTYDLPITLSGIIVFTGTYQNAINVGTYTIIPSISGLISTTYYLNFITGYLYIIPTNLTISINSYTKVYDSTNVFNDYTVNYSGLVDNYNPSVSISGTCLNAINTGMYTIIPYLTSTNSNYNIIYSTTYLTIIPASLLIIANNVTKIYDGMPYTDFNIIYDGFVGTDDSSSLTGSLYFTGSSQGANQAGTYMIVPNGFTSLNYNITYVPGILNIYTEEFLIAANNFIKFYDKLFFTNPTISYYGNIYDVSGNLVFNGSYINAVDVSSYSIIPSGLTSPNYLISYFNGKLVIDIAQVLITANSYTKVYDAIPFVDNGVSFKGLLGNDTSNNFYGNLINLGTSIGAVHVGSYNIIPSNLFSNNYSIIYVEGNLTITPAPLIITINNYFKYYDGTNNSNFTNFINISGIINNENISIIYNSNFRYSNAGYHFVDISSISISGLTAINYYILSYPTTIIGNILLQPLIITFFAPNKYFDGTTTVYSISYIINGITNNELITVSSFIALYRSPNAGYEFIDISNVILYGPIENYILNPINSITSLINPNNLLLVFSSGSKIYDSTNLTGPLNYYIQGNNPNDVLTISYIAFFPTSNIGSYYITISNIVLNGINSFLYTLFSISSTISATIFPRNITALFSSPYKVYDGTTITVNLVYLLINTVDNVSISSYIAFYRNYNTGYQIIDISNAILSSNNYLLNPINSISSLIYPKPVTVFFIASPKIYDGTQITPLLTYTISGQLEIISILSYISFYNSKNIGYQTITISNIIFTSNNYIGIPLSISGLINPFGILASFTGGNKIYDGTTNTGPIIGTLSGIILGDIVSISSFISIFKNINYGNQLVDISSIILYDLDSNNYFLSQTIYTITAFIDRKILDITFFNIYKIYDSISTVYQYSYTFSNIVGVDIVTISSLVGNYKNINVGLQLVDLSYIILSNNNYSINPLSSVSGYIDYKNLIVNFFGGSKIYDGYNNTGLLFYSISGLVSTDIVTVSSYIAFFNTVNSGINIINISNVILVNSSNYNLLPVLPINANIFLKNISILFNAFNKYYDSTTVFSLNVISIYGLVNTETILVTSYNANSRTPNVGYNIIDISNVLITSSNYNVLPITSINGYIYQKLITAYFSDGNKSYDGINTTGPITYTLSGVVNNEILSLLYTSFFENINIGINRITISNITISGFTNFNYYIIPFAFIYANIYSISITYNFTGGSKIYDGTTNISISVTLTGIVLGDIITVTSFSAAFSNPNVGLQSVNVTNITLSGTKISNYFINPPVYYTNIFYRPIIVNFFNGSKVYDSGFDVFSLTYTISNIINLENLTLSYYAIFKSIDAGYQYIDISNITIIGSTASNYTTNSETLFLSYIFQRPITVLVSNVNKIYDSLFTSNSIIITLSNILDNITVFRSTNNYRSKTIGTTIVDISNLTISGPRVYNYYYLPIKPTIAIISQRIINIIFSGGSKTYDRTSNAVLSYTLSGVAYNDLVAANIYYSNFTNNNVGLNYISISLVLYGSDSLNYSVYPYSYFAFIYQRPVIVSFSNAYKIYDKSLSIYSLSYLIINLVRQDLVTISYIALFSSPNVGYQLISISNVVLSSTNYYINSILPIIGYIDYRPITVTFNGGDKIYDKTYVTGSLNFTISNNLDTINLVSYSSFYNNLNAGIQRIDISTLVFTNFSNYVLLRVVPIYANIYRRPIQAVFTGGDKVYDTTLTPANTLAGTLSGLVSSDRFSIRNFTGIFRSPNAGLNIIDISNIVILNTNYTIVNIFLSSAYIYPYSLSVNFSGGNKIYNSFYDTGPITYILSGIFSSDTVSISSFTSIYLNNNVGRQSITISNIVLTSNNYITNYAAILVGIISPLPINVIFNASDKIYDRTKNVYNLTYTLSGYFNNVAISSLISFYNNINVGLQRIFISSIVLTSNNYVINTIPIFYSNILQRLLNIYFFGGNKIYDETTTTGSLTYSLSGIIKLETILITSYNSFFNNPNVGLQKISISNLILSSNNYSYFINDINAYISSFIATIIFTNINKVYDGTKNLVNISGYITNAICNVSNIVGFYRTTNAGSSIIDISSVVLSNSNIALSYIYPINAFIFQSPLIISFYGGTKIYDGLLTTGTISYNIVGIIYPDIVTVTSFISRFRNINVGNRIIDISNVVISNNNYYVIPVLSFTSTISPQPVNIQFIPNNKIYDQLLVATISNYIINYQYYVENIFITSYIAFFNSIYVGLNNITISNIVLSSTNYIVNSYTSYSAYIYPKQIYFITSNNSKFYDKTRNITLNNVSLSGLFFSDILYVTLSSYNGFFNTISAGFYQININNIYIQGLLAFNYFILNNAVTFGTILPKIITGTATGIDKVYDGEINAMVSNIMFYNYIISDVIILYSYSSTFTSANVSKNNVIKITNINIGNNYSCVDISCNANILPATYINFQLTSNTITYKDSTNYGYIVFNPFWNVIGLSIYEDFSAIYFNNNITYISSYQGSIITVQNNIITTTNYNIPINYFVMADQYNGIAICSSGTILTTTNGWSTVNYTYLPITINAISAIINNYCYIVGNNGAVYSTSDLGNTWTQLYTGINNNLIGISIIDISNLYIISNYNIVLSTNNYGNTWTIYYLGNYYFNSITMVNYLAGYIISDNRYILKTNNGINWINFRDISNSYLTNVFALNKDQIIIIGAGIIYRILNGVYLYYQPGVVNQLNAGYITDVNTIKIVGNIGVYLEYTLTLSGTITINNSYSTSNINFNYYLNQYTVGQYYLNVLFQPFDPLFFSAISNTQLLTIQPIFYYTNNINTLYTISSYSQMPITDQSGGIFSISSNILINSNGIISFPNTLRVNNYNYFVTYTFNNISTTTIYNLIVTPIIFYNNNISVLYYQNKKSSYPIVNPVGGQFSISGLNIDSSGLILFNNNYNLGTFIYTINYTFNNITNYTFFTVNVLPIIIYSPAYSLITYQSTNVITTTPLTNPIGGIFYADISNLTFNSNGQITFNGNYNIGIYYFNVYYSVLNVVNSISYTINVIPYLSYIPSTKTIIYQNYTIFDISAYPIYNPIGGIFSISSIVGTIDVGSGQIIVNNNLDVGKYNFIVTYTYNNSSVNYNYQLTVQPLFKYSPAVNIITYNITSNSNLPINNYYSGNYTITDVDSILVQKKLVTINSVNGIITSLSGIIVGSFNFNINYNNVIITTTNFNLIVIPFLNYSINNINIIYGISGYSVVPTYYPLGGIFTISSNVNVSINNGIIFYYNLNVGIYILNVIYTINNQSNTTNYIINVFPTITYSINNTVILYDNNINIYSIQPIVNQTGGLFFINSFSIDSFGVIIFSPSINVGNYNIIVSYLLNGLSSSFIYFLTVQPNITFTFSSITLFYLDDYTSELPYISPSGGIFTNADPVNGYYTIITNKVKQSNLVVTYTLNNVSNTYTINITVKPIFYYTISSLVLDYYVNDNSIIPFYSPLGGTFKSNLFRINSYGLLSFNNINFGNYNILITYTVNNISTTTQYNLQVITKFYYLITQTTLLYNTTGNSITPIYSFKNGYFTVNTISGINIDISSGLLTFNNDINVGIYNFNVIYNINNASFSTNYTLNIIPLFYYSISSSILLYDRNYLAYSNYPYVFPSGGTFSVIYNNNLINIDTISGIIIINSIIDVGVYNLIIQYTVNNLSSTTYYVLTILPNISYTTNYISVNYLSTAKSVIPYTNQANGTFYGNISVDSSGIIFIDSTYSVGYYNFIIYYMLNNVVNFTNYYFYVQPLIIYYIPYKNLNYGSTGFSTIPSTNPQNGIFSLSSIISNIIINSNGVISFPFINNIGRFEINVIYTLRNVATIFTFILNIYSLISYSPNYSTILYNTTGSSTSPTVSLQGGQYNIYDLSSNLGLTIDSSGIIYFYNPINVGNYSFLVTYNENNNVSQTIYYLTVIPVIYYTQPTIYIYYGSNYLIGQPYYDQSGGTFTTTVISNLFQFTNNIITINNTIPVGFYLINVIYALNNTSNNVNVNVYIVPVIIYDISSTTLVYGSTSTTNTPFINPINGTFYTSNNYNIGVDLSSGIINIPNTLSLGSYNINVSYTVNTLTSSVNYNINVIPFISYSVNNLKLNYSISGQSVQPSAFPAGGLFSLTDISTNYITIDQNGIIYVNSLIQPNNYSFKIYYSVSSFINYTTYNLNINSIFTYSYQYMITNYHTISYSVTPTILPTGGTFSASLTDININYSGISIDKNTGIIRFGLINAGFWNINVDYNINNIKSSLVYSLFVIANIYYQPSYTVIQNNITFTTSQPVIKVAGGTFTSSTVLSGFAINQITGVLTFTGLQTGLYNFSITYTVFGTSTTINYLLLVSPSVVYNPPIINTFYGVGAYSNFPTITPSGGIFSLDIDNSNLSIDISFGIVYTNNSINVGSYSFNVLYLLSFLSEAYYISFTVNVFPIFYYSIGRATINYSNFTYTEQPTVSPTNGIFISYNNLFSVNKSTGIIYLSNLTGVGFYSIPISYTYNSMSISSIYNLYVYPLFSYSINNTELVYSNSTQSTIPTAKQTQGLFNFVSISATTKIPYIVSFIDKYINSGVVLNGLTGTLFFGNQVNVGSYKFVLNYKLYDLSSNTTYSLIVKPSINYSISSVIIDYNTSSVSVKPTVNPIGGFFSLTTVNSNKIKIDNNTGIINFIAGANVGYYSIFITYLYANITNTFTYNVTIRPYYYYSIPSITLFYSDISNSVVPFTQQSGGNFQILTLGYIDSSNIIVQADISIDFYLGIIYFGLIDIGYYNLILQYTLNNSSITTNYSLTVIANVYYKPSQIYIQYGLNGYSTTPNSTGGIYGFYDITSLNSQEKRVSIDISSGVIYFNRYINTGSYNLIIYYSYNGTINYTNYNLIVIPLFYYTISSNVITYGQTFTSNRPYVQPINGLFYLSDMSNNTTNINTQTGILNFNNLGVNNYNIYVNYYIKNLYVKALYKLTVLPIFYYSNNSLTLVYNTESYSEQPYVNPVGGIFKITNLNSGITIDSSGILHFVLLDINNYNLIISYQINNLTSYYSYNLYIIPIFYYNESILSLSYNQTLTSSIPTVFNSGGTFTISNTINLINIDSNLGIITFNAGLDTTIYNVIVSYNYNNRINIFNYQAQVLPILYYSISSIILVYGSNISTTKPIYYNINGIFSIPSNFIQNGINIDISFGILYFNNIDVGNYTIPVNYLIINDGTTFDYYLTVVPNFYYDISSLNIDFNSNYYSSLPYVSPIDGVFSTTLSGYTININLSGVFNISNLNVGVYNLVISYTFNDVTINYNINLTVKPIITNWIYNKIRLDYSDVNYFINLIALPTGGTFTNYNGSYITLANPIVSYTFNNVTNNYILSYTFNPTFYYSIGYTILNALDVSNSVIPYVNPSGGVFSINNSNILLTYDGTLIFNNSLQVGLYNLVVNYRVFDLSSNFNYTLIVKPNILYSNKIYDYGIINYSEAPYTNVPNGIFSLTFLVNQYIQIDLISINQNTGIITFNLVSVGYYTFYINYIVNGIETNFLYKLIIRPVIVYDTVIINYIGQVTLDPISINPTGGKFYSSEIININTGRLSIYNAKGIFIVPVTYIYNNISGYFNCNIIVKPSFYYSNFNVITYNDISNSVTPYVSISGGTFNVFSNYVSINNYTGVLSYFVNTFVNIYRIPISYTYQDISSNLIFILTVLPYINYADSNLSITYGTTSNSDMPTVNPSGGSFRLLNNLNQVLIDSITGILTFSNTITVNNYQINIEYTFNNLSNIFTYNLNVLALNINVLFKTSNKLYDGTPSVQMTSNDLIGTINNDIVFVENSYQATYSSYQAGLNIPIYINNILLDGIDSYNYTIATTSTISGNIYYVTYNPNYAKINYGTAGRSVDPNISSVFDYQSFKFNNNTISGITIDVFYGVIYWDRSVPIGIYNLEVVIFNYAINFTFNYLLEVTTNLYLGLSVTPPISNLTFYINPAQLQYTNTTGYAYVLNPNIDGLVAEFTIIAYQNSNIVHDLQSFYPFIFYLPNINPNNDLIIYELNYDRTPKYNYPLQLTYTENNNWVCNIRYLSDFIVIDLNTFINSAPVIDPPGGVYFSNQSVTITSILDATIYYTLDGTNPTSASLIYNDPILITTYTVIKAYAVKTSYVDSPIATAEYFLNNQPCILSNSFIKTPTGYQVIDNLKINDLILTDDGRSVPIKNILKYKVNNPSERNYPILIPKNFFEPNVPSYDTYLSQNHGINYNNNWIFHYYNRELYKIVNIEKLLYYHLELPNFYTDNIIVNNMVVESWGINNKTVQYINLTNKRIKNYDINVLQRVKNNRFIMRK